MFSPSYRSGRLKALVLVLVVVISSQPLAPILELGGARYPSVLPRNIVSSMLRSVFLDASNPARGLLPSPKLSAVAASFDFAISVSPGSAILVQTASVSAIVSATLTSGASTIVTFSTQNLPSGVTATFTPASCSVTCFSSITFSALSTATTGSFTVMIIGTGGGLTRTADFQISVVQFDYGIFVSPGSGSLSQTGTISTVVAAVLPGGDFSSTTTVGFNAPINLPSGVSAQFSAPSCNPNCSSTLIFTATSTATPGTYSITITSTEGALTKTVTFTLTVAPFSFNLSISPNSVTVVPTASVSTLVTATLVSGTSASVSFGFSTPLPTGITATFTPPNCNLTCSSTLTFSASSSAANGNYPLTITSTSIGLTQTVGFTLTVAPFDFSVSVSPSSATVVQTASVSAVVSVTLPFSDTSSTTAVSFSIGGGGPPPGVTATFSPTSCNPNCSSTLTLSATSAAATGTFSFGIVADNGAGARRSAPFSLTVAPFGFSISVSPSSATVVQTASVSAVVSVTLPFSDTSSTTAVSFSINGGLPSGITATFSPTSCNPNCSSTVTFSATSNAQIVMTSFGIAADDGAGHRGSASFSLTVSAFDFGISAAPSSATVAQAGSVQTIVTLTLPNSDSSSTTSVTFAADPTTLPTGVTATFSPASCSPNCFSTVTFTASSTATTGTSLVTITGTGGGVAKIVSFTLTVIAFDFSMLVSPGSASVVQSGSVAATVKATLTSGTSALVSLSAQNLPAGVTAKLTPASCNPGCSSTVVFATDLSVSPGIYSVTLAGVGAGLMRTASFSLTVVAFDFSVIVNPSSGTVAQTGTISTFVTVVTNVQPGAFVDLTATDVPLGVTSTFTFVVNAQCPPNQCWSLAFSADSTASTGTFTVMITGTGGGVTRTANPGFTLTVVPSFDYFVSVSPNSGLLVQAASISTTVTASLISGSTSGSVSFTTTNLPPSVTIAANDCTPNCSTTLTFTAYSTTPTGTFTVTILGVDFGITRMTSFALTVGPGPSVGGEVVPVNKLGLLVPYLALSSIIILSALAMIHQLLRRRRIEGQSTFR